MTKTILFLALLQLHPSAWAAAVDRENPPQPDPEVVWSIPKIYRHTLDNGLKIFLIPDPKIPLATVNFFLRGRGYFHDPRGKEGLAALTSELVRRGTKTKTGPEIALEAQSLGRFGSEATPLNLSVGVKVVARKLEEGIAFLADVVRHSTFPKKEFELEQKAMLQKEENAKSSSEELADRQFARLVYGKDGEMSRVPTKASLKSLSRQDVAAYYAQATPADAELFIVGDVDVEKAAAWAAKHFGSWSGKNLRPSVGSPKSTIRLTKPEGQSIHFVPRPHSAQSEIRIGHAGIPRNHPDYYAVTVMNFILGGDELVSRLAFLRVEKKWSYGTVSRFSAGKNTGHFAIMTSVQNNATSHSVRALILELARFRNLPGNIRQNEVNEAKTALEGRFLFRTEKSGGWVDQDDFMGKGGLGSFVAEARHLGLGEDEVYEYQKKIRAVTLSQVEEAAQKYLDPANLYVIVIGDPGARELILDEQGKPVLDGEGRPVPGKTILEALRELAPVTVYDADGNPVPAS